MVFRKTADKITGTDNYTDFTQSGKAGKQQNKVNSLVDKTLLSIIDSQHYCFHRHKYEKKRILSDEQHLQRKYTHLNSCLPKILIPLHLKTQCNGGALKYPKAKYCFGV